jgi:hypothetical protein
MFSLFISLASIDFIIFSAFHIDTFLLRFSHFFDFLHYFDYSRAFSADCWLAEGIAATILNSRH